MGFVVLVCRWSETGIPAQWQHTSTRQHAPGQTTTHCSAGAQKLCSELRQSVLAAEDAAVKTNAEAAGAVSYMSCCAAPACTASWLPCSLCMCARQHRVPFFLTTPSAAAAEAEEGLKAVQTSAAAALAKKDKELVEVSSSCEFMRLVHCLACAAQPDMQLDAEHFGGTPGGTHRLRLACR